MELLWHLFPWDKVVRFLGFLVDFQLCTCLLPEDEKLRFTTLREHILAN